MDGHLQIKHLHDIPRFRKHDRRRDEKKEERKKAEGIA